MLFFCSPQPITDNQEVLFSLFNKLWKNIKVNSWKALIINEKNKFN